MPFVGCGWPVSPDAIREMAAKAIDPLSDRFPADRHTAFGEKIFTISGAQRKAMVDPDGVGNDLLRKTKALHARAVNSSERADKLAIPAEQTNRSSSLLIEYIYLATKFALQIVEGGAETVD